MRFWSRGEFVFLAALVIAGAVDGYFLYRDLTATRAGEGKEQIGTIHFKQNRAERKVAGQVLWDGLEQDGPVYNRDTIRTSRDSLATIRISGEETSIEMSEETLVYIDFGRKEAAGAYAGKKLELRGQAFVTKAAGGASIELSTRGGKVTLDEGYVAVEAGAEVTSVSVLSGKASLESAAGKLDLDEASATAVSSASAAPALREPVLALAPKKGLKLVCLGPEASVRFAWKLPAGAGPARLLVSAKSDFTSPLLDLEVEGEDFLANLAPGSYYWKALAGGAEGPAQRFSIVRDMPPDPIKPAFAAVLAGGDSLIGFSWKPSANALGYRLELASDPGFTLPLEGFPIRTQATRVSAAGLGDGTFYWRAVALYSAPGAEAAGFESPGASSSFEVRVPKAVAAPKLADKALRVSAAAAGSGKIFLSWEAVPGAEAYLVIVSRDEAGKEVVLSERSKTSSIRLDGVLAKGDYFVRVRSEAAGKLSPPSEPRSLAIFAPEPLAPLSPKADASLAADLAAVDFSWRDPNRGARYKLEVADDASFKKPLASAEAAGSSLSLPDSAALRGIKWWRVSLLDEEGSALAMSGPVRFVFPRALVAPSRGRPEGGEKIDLVYESRIAFDWSPVPGATEYRLVLYRLGSGEGVKAREWTKPSPGFVLDSFTFLAPDDYAWDIIAYRKEGELIIASSPASTRYFSLIQSKSLEPPDLGSEIEIFLE